MKIYVLLEDSAAPYDDPSSYEIIGCYFEYDKCYSVMKELGDKFISTEMESHLNRGWRFNFDKTRLIHARWGVYTPPEGPTPFEYVNYKIELHEVI